MAVQQGVRNMAAQQGILSPDTLLRPQATAAFLAKSTPARIGLVLAILGFMLAMVPFIGSAFNATLVADATPDEGSIAANGIWTFGLATASFGMIKLGIALILFGVVRRIWIRVESVKAGLAKLVPAAENKNAIDSARITTPFGVANVTATAPKPLGIHRMAYKMWAPMAVMGIIILGIGLIFSIIAAVNAGDNDFVDFRTFAALGQGTEFLGEALLLSGIAFLLGSVMGSLRQGGGELQESLGVAVKTPAMPVTAKLFVALMMIGLMLGMLQFVLYLVVAANDSAASVGAWFAWLGPLREASLGIILSGIVLALATIGTKILPFQFWRMQALIRNGK